MTLGAKLKELREGKDLLLRQVAAKLEVDPAFISKLEHDEKIMSRKRLEELATIYQVSENVLLPLWLAQKVKKAIQDETFGRKALEMVLKDLP